MNLADIIILLAVGGLLYLCIRSLVQDRRNGVPSCGAQSCSSCGIKCGAYKACEVIANRKKKDMVA